MYAVSCAQALTIIMSSISPFTFLRADQAGNGRGGLFSEESGNDEAEIAQGFNLISR